VLPRGRVGTRRGARVGADRSSAGSGRGSCGGVRADFAPAGNRSGTDTFTFEVQNALGTNSAQATIDATGEAWHVNSRGTSGRLYVDRRLRLGFAKTFAAGKDTVYLTLAHSATGAIS
jgi:hypothetical protein